MSSTSTSSSTPISAASRGAKVTARPSSAASSRFSSNKQNNTGPTTPASMTETAKEKLRTMWSTIRSMTLDEDEGASTSSSKRSNSAFAKLKKVMELEGGANSTMDHVMKTLFSSCTNGMPDEDHPQDKAHPTTTAGMTKNPMHHHDAAAVAIAAAAATATTQQPTTTTTGGVAAAAAATTGPMLLRKENCYAQFLSNDKERAARAVTSLRQHSFEQEQQLNRGMGTMPTGNNVPPSPPTTPNGRVVPRPFHVSTPPRSAQPTSLARTRPQPLLPEELECPQMPIGADNTNATTTILMDGVPRTNSMNDHHVPTSFDDGISAISAHTLEEMVRQEELQTQQRLGPVRSDLTSEGFDHPVGRNRSTESTLFPPTPSTMNDNEYITIKPSATSPAIRSHGSWKSKGNRSFSTKSTKSSSDFEAVWRKHEQQYWEDIVMEEGDEDDGEDDIKQPRRMESGSRTMVSRKNGTFGRTTVGSGQSKHNNATIATSTSMSSYSGSSPFGGSSNRHPHDTYHFDDDNHDAAFTHVISSSSVKKNGDPDQIQSVLLTSDMMEVGEI